MGGTGWGGSEAEGGTGKGVRCSPVPRRRHGRNCLAIASPLPRHCRPPRSGPSPASLPGEAWPAHAAPSCALAHALTGGAGRRRPLRARRKAGSLGVTNPRPATRDPERNQRHATRDPERPGPPGLARTFVKGTARIRRFRPGLDICQDREFDWNFFIATVVNKFISIS